MAADSAGNTGRPASERNEHYAALIRANRNVILTSFSQRLAELYGPAAVRSPFLDHVMAGASEVLTDVAESVLAAEVRVDRRMPVLWRAERAGTENCPSPVEWLRPGGTFFSVAVTSLEGYVRDEPDLLPCFTLAVLALNESISRRIGEVTAAYTGFLLNRVHEAQVEERRRIARDLHDRLGERLSLGLRQLDLLEISSEEPASPSDSRSRADLARKVLADAMQRLRLVTADLREEPVTSLEKALIRYLDSATGGAEVRLRVNGDEAWASPAILDEVFLMIREAVRNALAHGAPQLVLINVDLAPHELRASVEDDGRGFVLATSPESGFMGTGLVSMRERAALLGGRLKVSSTPGSGTSVELVVSLPGHRDE